MCMYTHQFLKQKSKKGQEKAAITTVASLRPQMECGGWLYTPSNVVTLESVDSAQTFQAGFCKC